MHYVYVLKSKSKGNLYIGLTSDLKRRFEEHNKGSSLNTAPGIPWELIYYEAYKNQRDARKREKKLKQFKNSYSKIRDHIKYSLKT